MKRIPQFLVFIFCLTTTGLNAVVFNTTWTGGAGTSNWSDAGNWSGAVVPDNDPTDQFNVFIDGGVTTTDVTVQLAGDTIQLNSLSIDSGESLTGHGSFGNNGFMLTNSGLIDANSSGNTLYLKSDSGSANSGDIQSSGGGTLFFSPSNGINNGTGSVASYGVGSQTVIFEGTLFGGYLKTGDGGTILVESATLDSVTNQGETTLQGQDNEFGTYIPKLKGSITNDNSFIVDGANQGYTGIDGDVSLGGSGTTRFTSNGRFRSANNASTDILRNQGGHTIVGSGHLGDQTLVLHNAGIIRPEISGNFLYLEPGPGSTNTNGIQSNNGGILYLLLSQGLDNTSGVIASYGTDSLTQLSDGTVFGGYLETGDGGTILVESATLDSVTNQGETTLQGQDNEFGTYIPKLKGSITNDNSFIVDGANQGYTGIDGDVSLGGFGVTNLTNSGILRGANNAIGDKLINDLSHTISGHGSVGLDGTFEFENRGLVDANAPGQSLHISSYGLSGWRNTGTIQASNGGQGYLTTGIMDNTNGIVRSDGANSLMGILGADFNDSWQIAYGTIEAVNSGRVEISTDAVVSQSTLATSTGGLITVLDATLNNVQITGDVTLNSPSEGTNDPFNPPTILNPVLKGTIQNEGAITVVSGPLGALLIDGVVTLTGNGTMT
ncbi:MAG: hypothetical protein AAFX93_18900, partial [Verrucomicrobiota bacterium]